MIAKPYNGMKGWPYIFGEGKAKDMIVFDSVGAESNLGSVLDFSDAALFVISVVNAIGLHQCCRS
ncbi:hypothetical protein ROE7235_00468 [Roseibaca ekhonensis]|uniref:Uncharacterized protein n=2 Tax=Roseinatronobacter ekhonensis TaxID=254356 RepID=A0A3B0M3P2_9RHOB|nr:hypothetical protein ROE7235_00468 [Roseibaca ekhonensis]